MSEQANDTRSTVHDIAEMSRDKLACAQDGARDALGAATDYIRANPWIAVGGAAVLGGVLAAVSHHNKKAARHGNLDALRDWLDDAYAKLPNQKQVQSMADSCGVPDFFKQLRKKLHLN